MSKFTVFLGDDAGAVTVDWVALVSAILLLGVMTVYAIFNGGVAGLVLNVNATLTSVVTDVDTGTVPNLTAAPSPAECLKTKKGIKCVK